MSTFFGAVAGQSGEAVVLGAPYAHGSPRGGGCTAAPATLRALTQGECIGDGICDYRSRRTLVRQLRVSDLGDIAYRASLARADYFDELRRCAERLASAGSVPFTLGGDHSITLPLASGVARALGNIQIVILDAHHDDSPVAPSTRPTHANFVRFLAAEPGVRRIVQIGLRGYSSLVLERPANVIESDIGDLSAQLERGTAVYLSIDTDAFDPALAPAVGHPLPAGLTWDDLDRVVETLMQCACPIAGVDWTEYDPTLEDRNYPTGIAIVQALVRLLDAVDRQRYQATARPPAQPFPFDLMDSGCLRASGDGDGRRIDELGPLSLSPPFPWGQWLYARLLRERLPSVPGDLIECGVGKGGMSLFLGGFAARAGRRLYALDTFRGLPAPDPANDNAYFREADYSSKAERGDLMSRFLDVIAREQLTDTIVPIQGLLQQTLPTLPRERRFAFVHIDVDLYASTLVCINELWPRLNEDGLLVIDDFFHHAQGPARAAGEFFRRMGKTAFYHISFPYSVVVVKGEAPPDDLPRAIDGNWYTLDWLRRDAVLRQAIQASAAAAAAAGSSRRASNAALLESLLQPRRTDRSSDIYDYWRALEEYWDDMDVVDPGRRMVIQI